MSGELVYSGDWEIEEKDWGPSELAGSCTCPRGGEWASFSEDVEDEVPTSGYSLDCECEICGCKFLVELA